MYAWPESVCPLVDKIAEQHGIEWDTDSNINVLTSFIEEHCDPSEFIAHVTKCAEYDAEQQRKENQNE